MKTIGRITLLVIVGLGLQGCFTREITYPMEPIIKVDYPNPTASIIVAPAVDKRGNKRREYTIYLELIPLVPYGWTYSDRPEIGAFFSTISHFRATMTEEIPQAIADHLQRSGYASDVRFDAQSRDADYVLEVDLLRSRYRNRRYTYCMSVAGVFLYFVAFPVGESTMFLELDLRLKDRDGEIVWTHTLDEEYSILQGLYYNWGDDMHTLAYALQAGLEKLVVEKPL